MTITCLTLAALVSLGAPTGSAAAAEHAAKTKKPSPSKPDDKPAAKGGPEEALRALDQQFVGAFNSKNVDALAALYAEDAVVMDPGPAMWCHGRDEIKKNFAKTFEQFELIQISVHDANYKVSGNVGYGYGLWHLKGKLKGGQMVDDNGRYSSVYAKTGGNWMYQVDHASVPSPPPPPPNGAVVPQKQ